MSRRNQIRMTDQEARDFVRGAQTIIINSIGKDGVPHPMPMWFGVEGDGSIVMTTFRKSQKVRNLRRDPRVSLLVEDGTVYSELRGVVIYGTAELVEDTEKVLDILAEVSSRNQPLDEAGKAGLRKALLATAAKRVGIRVKPEHVVSWDHRKLGGVY
jgi:PPOX class probable F420-dependent enzyme